MIMTTAPGKSSVPSDTTVVVDETKQVEVTPNGVPDLRTSTSKLGAAVTKSNEIDSGSLLENSKSRKALASDMQKSIVVSYHKSPRSRVTKWRFPWRLCQQWQGMQELIKQAFSPNAVLVENIVKGSFYLEGPDRCIILPQLWEIYGRPGLNVTLKFSDSVLSGPVSQPMPLPPSYPGGIGPIKPPVSMLGTQANDYSSGENSSSSGSSDDSDVENCNQTTSKRGRSQNQRAIRTPRYDFKVGRSVRFFKKPDFPTQPSQFLYEKEYRGDIIFIDLDEKFDRIPILQEIIEVESVMRKTDQLYGPGPYPPPASFGPNLGPQKNNSKTLVLGHGEVIKKRILRIRSPVLLNALCAIVKYSSSAPSGDQDALKDGIFTFPYQDLFQHKEELLAYKQSHPSREVHSDSENRECDQHIDLLLKYLKEHREIRLEECERRWEKIHPMTTFSSFWLLLKPGSDVYVQENGQLNAYVIESTTGGQSINTKWTLPYQVNVWYLAYKSLTKTICRSMKVITVPVFDGEREITSLPIFPARFHRDEPGHEPLLTKLIKRGKKYVELVKGPAFREYSGKGQAYVSHTYERERIVVTPPSGSGKYALKTPSTLYSDSAEDSDSDSDQYPPAPSPPNQTLLGGGIPGNRARMPFCPCSKCDKHRTENSIYVPLTYGSYDKLSPQDSVFTDHQYSLCESHVDAFVLKDHIYDVLDVACISEPIMNTYAIDRLVMKAESNKSLLKAICRKYNAKQRGDKVFSVDFIRGKGEGQVILLHGPPGTGKTLTAESVAEFTNRPLLAITAADLGHEPSYLEESLLAFFKDANDWGAIVLLDEADIYLERRSTEDLSRNSVVSIFLRALDYFKGILFLTTNRVGSFDEAFMSRIHIQIGYDPLDSDARRQIWAGYFEKLRLDHEAGGREIRYDWAAKEYAQRSPEIIGLRWNGREIRNAFQTAVTLALDEAEEGKVPIIKETHLQQVVKMSQSFKEYMKSTHEDLDDSEMAYRSGLRDDKKKNDY